MVVERVLHALVCYIIVTRSSLASCFRSRCFGGCWSMKELARRVVAKDACNCDCDTQRVEARPGLAIVPHCSHNENRALEAVGNGKGQVGDQGQNLWGKGTTYKSGLVRHKATRQSQLG